MRRKFFSIITALALCLSLCPTWAFAVEGEPDTGLCDHHPAHTEDCGYTAPTEGHDCGHEHTEDCYTTDEAGSKVLDCRHSHDSECGYVQADPGASCGYVCRICPIEDLIAALPEQVTEDNAEVVRARLDEILDLFTALDEDEQGQLDLSRVTALQEALDAADAPMQAAEEVTINNATVKTLTAEDGGCQGHTFTGTAQGTTIYVESGTHDVTFSNLKITGTANVGVAPNATMNLTIDGTNTIHAGGNLAGIYVPVGATLVINGIGSLNVSGNGGGAGIGGAAYAPDEDKSNGDPNCGTVEIKGGTVTATGGNLCIAGIGGGMDVSSNPGNGGTVTINGGTVTATGGSDGTYGGAGIGGGGGVLNEWSELVSGSGGTLTINGGHVTLAPGQYDSTNSTAYGFGRGSSDPNTSAGTCELTLADESYLDSSTTLDPKGKYTINGDPTADMIVVPELVYTGEALDTSGIKIDDTKTGTGTYFNQTFTVNASADGWELQPLSNVVEAGEYTATFKKGDKEISKTFTVAKSGTQFVGDGEVKTYNGDTLTTSFSAGDTITVKATPTATGAAPQKAAARLRADPMAGQMAVFVNDTQVSAPVGVGADGTYTMEVSAADVLLAAGGPDAEITLTAKFVGNNNMADGTGTVTVNITAVAKAERDGKVIGYYDASGLADAFARNSGNDGATITLLDNITTSTQIDVGTDNLTLDLNGKTYTHINNTPFRVSYGSLTIKGSGEVTTSGYYCLVVGEGTLNIKGGSFSSKDSAVLVVSGGTLQLTGGSFTGNQNAIVYESGEVTEALANYGEADAPHYAFYQGSSPYAPSGKTLPSGTFTVQECQHTGVTVQDQGNGKHGLTCPYCGYHSEHTTTLTATASGNTVTLNGGCDTEGCNYAVELGTVSFTFENLVYGNPDAKVSWIKGGPTALGVMLKIDNALNYVVQSEEATHSCSLTNPNAEAGTPVTAKPHTMKVSFYDDGSIIGTKTVECELTFTVAPAPLTAEMVTLGETEVTYNGQAQEPTVTADGLTEGTDYTVAYSNNVNVGTATVTVTGKGNYTGTIEKTFQIKPATLTVTPPTAALSYGQKLSDSTLTGGGATNSNGDTVTGNWEWANPEEQPKATGDFSATFKPTDTKNYETPESVDVNVTVNPATPNITLTVPSHQVAEGEVTVTCTVENPHDASWKDDLPTVTLSCSDSSVTIENGKFTIPEGTAKDTKITVTASTAAVDGKYTTATKTATVTVTDKIPVTIHAEAVSRAYNGQPFTISTPVVRGQDGQTVADAAVAYTWSTDEAPVNAGDYTVTIDLTEAAKKTYAAQPLELSFSITKASATVTANSQTITKGDPAPAYTCTVSPTGADLGFTPTLSCAYTTESGAGEYPITVDGDKVSTDGNYTITYVNGKLTVKEPSSSGGGGGGDTPVNVTGVSLDRNSLTLTIGESFSLTVTITPSNADNKSVTWASSNPDVASVSGGTVTAVGPGTTTITVTTRSGGHTASCTVTVKAKVYTITYDPNGGTGTMRTGSAADGEPFTLPGCTFTPPEGKVFDAWAIGSADGTQAKAGSSHTFTEDTTVYAVWKDAPLVTYAVTYNANGGTGTMTDGIAPDQEAFVLPECGFTAPEGKEFDCWAIGSATGPKVQPGGGYTFTANTTVYALWKDLPPVPYDITGIVWQNGEAVPGATVQLKRGADVVAAQTTGADGGFTFSGVPAGVYNLVAIKDGITVTVMQEITSGSVNLTITLPNGKTNTVVEIKGQEGTPPVVVGEMENLFTDDTVYTAEDKEIVATGGTVEFKMVVGKQDASSSAAIQIEASKPAGQTIGLFLDLSIIKTVTPKDGQAETTSVTQVGSLIETLIPLPDEMQGKASYTVYREHDGIVEALPNSGNGERYTVSSDKKSITIYARKYSTYAVAWSDNGGDTPVDPDKPSRPSGGGGSSVSTYAVTVSKTTYGKVVSSRTNASSGSTVTLTVTPDSGYTLDTLTVTDSRGNAVKLTDKGDGKYTFTMPSRAVTVTASFAPIVWNNPYTDVATGTWYYEAVRFVSENGLMGGYGKGLFGPNDNLSRAQLVQILYNHAGRPVIQNGSTFTDAAPGAWYADAVAWAAAEGIISGYGGGRFGPNDPITREQLAVILWRYAGFPVPPNLLLDFPDANTASGYALDALRWAVEQGIISGYSNGRLEPKTPATRGQVAQILRNFLQKQ